MPTDTPTATPIPTDTSVPTEVTPTPTETSVPATATATVPPPPTDTPTPEPTVTPSYRFSIWESRGFSVNKPNFDVYIAITNSDNIPLGGYRVLARHSGGMQMESAVSAWEWVANSGAMHYKAGNIKLEVPNSPGGVWTLQLVDEGNQSIAPPVDFSFDPANGSWYFLLYREGG